MKTEITRADIIDMDSYGRERAERRARMVAVKRARRLEVGPCAVFLFENYETMWQQIHEMLYIEKGGEAQIEDELRAYGPLVPRGANLVATVMFEVENAERRQAFLATLGGVETTMSLAFSGHTIAGRPDGDIERTNAEGKASSVHFMHFDFTPEQVAAFRSPATEVVAAISHPAYRHMTVVPDTMRATLAEDFT